MRQPVDKTAAVRESLPGVCNGFGTESPVDYAFSVVDAAEVPIAKRGHSITLCPASEIPPGERRIFELDNFSVGVYNIDGRFHAIKNVCPHAGAPLCQGKIQTTHRPSGVGEYDPAFEGRIVRCPWHGWEFDVVTGKGLYDRQGRVASYPVEETEAGLLVLKI